MRQKLFVPFVETVDSTLQKFAMTKIETMDRGVLMIVNQSLRAGTAQEDRQQPLIFVYQFMETD